MKQKKEVILITFILLFTRVTFAQDIEVKEFEPLENAQMAVRMRNDNNGNSCALLKVQSLKEGLEFEGWVVGDVEYKDDVYMVFIANGAKHIKIKHTDYQTKDVVFGDYGISSLIGGQTYSLHLVDDTKDIINKVYQLGWNLDGMEVPNNARTFLKMAATRGDVKAQIAMAQLATVKNGDSGKNESGYYWIEKLLSKGDSTCLDKMPGELMYIYACRQKSKIWRGSSRVNRDEEKDIYSIASLYELKACAKGYKRAGDDLFIDFPQSNGLSEGCDLMYNICLDSAATGNLKAMRCLGVIYEMGMCKSQNLSIAADWYNKVYEIAPTNQSKTDLVRIYGNRLYPIDQTKIDFIKQQAAEGLPEALFQLGYMYEEGRNVPKDINMAMDYYLKASPENSYTGRHPKAACRLAEIYYNRKEYKKASKFLTGIDDDDALYLKAIIDYYQYDYTDNRIKVFNTLNYLSKKGYQKAIDFIKDNY
ncbi:MAG: sel1 repeat family protein [Prevotella sp.]|nr:sel1 repeat family protein [Prevotella sp.]